MIRCYPHYWNVGCKQAFILFPSQHLSVASTVILFFLVIVLIHNIYDDADSITELVIIRLHCDLLVVNIVDDGVDDDGLMLARFISSYIDID